jgi:hypothetical protein
MRNKKAPTNLQTGRSLYLVLIPSIINMGISSLKIQFLHLTGFDKNYITDYEGLQGESGT